MIAEALPRRRRLRLTVIGLCAALALAVAGSAWLFWSNTESLSIAAEADPTSPGEAVTIDLGIGDHGCGPSFAHLYRRTLAARWQLTHTSSDGEAWVRHDRGLLSLGSWQEFSLLPCSLSGAATLVMPSDVSWSPVVACSHDDNNCVRVEVSP